MNRKLIHFFLFHIQRQTIRKAVSTYIQKTEHTKSRISSNQSIESADLVSDTAGGTANRKYLERHIAAFRAETSPPLRLDSTAVGDVSEAADLTRLFAAVTGGGGGRVEGTVAVKVIRKSALQKRLLLLTYQTNG